MDSPGVESPPRLEHKTYFELMPWVLSHALVSVEYNTWKLHCIVSTAAKIMVICESLFWSRFASSVSAYNHVYKDVIGLNITMVCKLSLNSYLVPAVDHVIGRNLGLIPKIAIWYITTEFKRNPLKRAKNRPFWNRCNSMKSHNIFLIPRYKWICIQPRQFKSYSYYLFRQNYQPIIYISILHNSI